MKRVEFWMLEEEVAKIDALIPRKYRSRAEAFRTALRDFIKKEARG